MAFCTGCSGTFRQRRRPWGKERPRDSNGPMVRDKSASAGHGTEGRQHKPQDHFTIMRLRSMHSIRSSTSRSRRKVRKIRIPTFEKFETLYGQP